MNEYKEYYLKLKEYEKEDFNVLKEHNLEVNNCLSAKFGSKTFFIFYRQNAMDLVYYLLILNDKLEREQLVTAKSYEELHKLFKNYVKVYENE